LGGGGWGLGGGGLGPTPQAPIPNPQSPIPNYLFFSYFEIKIKKYKYIIYKKRIYIKKKTNKNIFLYLHFLILINILDQT
jgi:hypothetical protein